MASKPQVALAEALIFPTNPEMHRKLDEAEQLLRAKDWKEAIKLLQRVLDAEKDTLVERTMTGADGAHSTYFISAWFLADRLLGRVPARGMAYYGEAYGPRARDLLNKATAAKDEAMVAEVARRFGHTEAGLEAHQQLAVNDVNRGQFETAAARFKRLLRDGDVSLPIGTLLSAGIAFHRVGDQASADRVWERLKTQVNSRPWPQNDPVRNDRMGILKRLRAELDKVPLRKQVALSDWPLLGGDRSRNARAVGSAPFLSARWQTSTVHDQYQGDDPVQHPDTDAWLKMAVERQRKLKLPVLSPFHPIAVNKKIIFRSYGAIVAVYIKDGQDNANGKYRAGEMAWKSPMDGALSSLLAESNYRSILNEWQDSYRETGFNTVFENSMVGTLSTDAAKVYTVDDLAIPPHPQWTEQWESRGGLPPSYPGRMSSLVDQNVLRAYNVDCGKLLWQLPDHRDQHALADSHFLGAPLSIGGKLYVLNEKKSELRLLCLEQKLVDAAKDVWEVNGVRTQALCGVKTPITNDIVRRMQAVNLAYSDGILVVPTNAGAVLGIDLLSQTLLWAYSYQKVVSPKRVAVRLPSYRGRTVFNLLTRTLVKIEKEPGRILRFKTPSPAIIAPQFKMFPPIISDGRLVFAAPEADAIDCVDLDTGTRVWEAKRTDDLYLAGVYDGQVLMVGKTGCRALALKDGKQLWALEVGAPSGRGIATSDTYYLPLQKGEICAIDLARGKVKAHIKSPTGEALGNLIFHDGHLLSQTATSIAAYPQLDVMLGEIQRALARNPRDPTALTERGDLRLASGKVPEAVADLRAALGARPPAEILPRTRRLLFEAFTDLFQRDFATAWRAHIKEFEEVCRTEDPAETRRRLSRFHFIVGVGCEHQGELVRALRSYLAIAELAGPTKYMPAPDDPQRRVRADVWARGRITALLKRASPEQRKALEAEIEKRWQEMLAPKKKS
jgi:outer membrane protein assembly factor BamB